MKNKSKELKVAIKAALEAGKILEKYFETEILKDFKEDKSIVTLADKESEQVIKSILLKEFPEHSLLGEETGMTENKSDYVWYVDPVDGTRNFANAFPLFVVSIALAYKGELIVGVIYNPATRSLFYAEKGKGAYLKNKKIHVSKDDRDRAIVTLSPSQRDVDKDLHRELSYYFRKNNVVRSLRNFGCTALEMAYVARGGLEANIQLGLYPYDFAAGVLLIQEAGGKITALDGGQWKFPDNYFIASNGVFHDILVKEVQNQLQKLTPSASAKGGQVVA